MKRPALLIAGLVLALGLSAHAGPGAVAPLPVPTTLRDAERELADLDRLLTEADAARERLTAAVAMRERRTLARSRAYARLARAGLLPVAGGFDAFAAHAVKIESARRAIVNDLDSLRSLRRDQIDVAGRRDTLAARRAVVVAQRDALGQAQSLLDEAEDRRRAFERAFSSSGAGVDHAAIYGGSGVSVRDAAPSGGFESARGRLMLPLAGRAEIRSGRRNGGGSAVELVASAGAPARAVFAGRVAFTGAYADYGKLVLVDHGEGFFTLYGNLGQIDVRVGDELSAGNRVGSVGDAGALSFEVRHRGETLDARPWLGL